MRVKNETHYNTADLRRFFLAGLKAMGAETSKRIRVVYSRRGLHWGCASYGSEGIQGSRVTMSVPKGGLLLLHFAQVFEHEVAHTLGLRHEDMAEEVKWCRQEVEWHLGLEIRHEEPVTLPPVDPAAKREEKARRALERWERRLKRARTMVAKWGAKVRYYERRAAAKPAAEKGGTV